MLASGDLPTVAVAARVELDRDEWAQILIFDNDTGELRELDLRGTAAEVLARLAPPDAAAEEPRRAGRPKLGVVAREVTLLPRHWDWLASQPGGASVVLRRLVEQARLASTDRDRRRRAQEAAYRFLNAAAGNQPGFEEALRALFADHAERFAAASAAWPADIRAFAHRLAAFDQPAVAV